MRIPINGRSKEELDNRIKDLKERGFRVITEPTPKHQEFTAFDLQKDGKYVYAGTSSYSAWYAILAKDSK